MAFGDIFGDSSFDVNFSTDDAVRKLVELIGKLNKLGKSGDEIQHVLSHFFSKMADDASLAHKPLDQLTSTLENVRKLLKMDGAWQDLSKTSLQNVAKKLLGGNSNPNFTEQERAVAEKKFLKGDDEGGENGGMSRGQRLFRTISQVKVLVSHISAMAVAIGKVNREVYLLAYNAQMAVKEIAAMGGALEAYGGTKGDAANFAKSFETEIAKMQVGQGTGGKFMEAARLWGLEWIPESFEEQEKAIVQFLSDPNRTKTEKIGLQNTLGLSAAQVSRYSRGLEEFERENAIQKELHKNTEDAANASDEFNRSIQHLSAAWTDFKNEALVPLMKVLTPVIEKMSRFVKWVRDLPLGLDKLLAFLALLAGAFFSLIMPITRLIATLNMARIAANQAAAGNAAGAGGGMFGWMKGITAAGATGALKKAGIIGTVIAGGMTAVEAVSEYSSGNTAKGNTALAKGAGGIAGMWGGAKIGAAIGTAIAPGIGTAIGGFLGGSLGYFMGEKAGEKIGEGINKGAGVGNKRDKSSNEEDAAANEAFSTPGVMERMLAFLKGIMESTDELVFIVRGQHEMAAISNAASNAPYDLAYAVNIETISINVASASSDPEEVANAVRECLQDEFRQVVVSRETGRKA